MRLFSFIPAVAATRSGSILAFVLATLAATAGAQPPDAGALQQQIERDVVRPLPEVVSPPAPVAPAEKPAPAGVTVTVSAFEFVGNSRLSSAELQQVVQKFVGRPLSFDELQAAAGAVAEAYRAAGWVVRVFLPPQDLVDGGVVRIQVVEAKFGAVGMQFVEPATAETLRVRPERLQAMVQAAQEDGGAVNSRAVDRALLLLDDLAGVGVKGSLAAGKVEGETDLVLRVQNEPALGGDVRIDNTGSLSTGRERLLGNLAWRSPTRSGDLATMNLLATEGSRYARLAYRRPVGYDGWMVGVNASEMRYELIGDDYVALDASGSAGTASVEASYPLLRSSRTNLSFGVAPEHKGYYNESAGVVTTDYVIDVLPLSLTGSHNDAFARGGSTSANLVLTLGEVDLTGSPNIAADALTTQTEGGFAKLRYLVSRQQTLSARSFLRVNLSGQVADGNLDSAEKFYLGGAAGVRAYPSSDGGGSEGHMLNAEVHVKLPKHFASYVFYDDGWIRINHDNEFPGAPALNNYSLRGAGVGLGWSHPKGISARVTWAYRIGDNPNATAAGKDMDGTLIKNRIWAEASLAF